MKTCHRRSPIRCFALLFMAAILASAMMPAAAFAAISDSVDAPEPVELPQSGTYDTNSLIIQYKSGLDSDSLVSDAGVDADSTSVAFDDAQGTDIAVVKVADDEDLAMAAARLEDDPAIESVSFNYKIHATSASSTPNDTYYSKQWALNDSNGIDAKSVWGTGVTGSDQAVVAVLDSGVDLDHPDLKDELWTYSGSDLDVTTGQDASATTTIKTTLKSGDHGIDFVDNDSTPDDEYGHGTHCAGIIGAEGNNGQGITGVCQNVKIMPLRILGSDGSGDLSGMLYAYDFIDTLMQKGTKVVAISNSYGADIAVSSLTSDDKGFINQMDSVMDKVGALGALTMTAAGNQDFSDGSVTGGEVVNFNDGTYLSYPACCTSTYNICVAATDSSGALCSWSYRGSNYVDIAAPGEDILSTCYPNAPATKDSTGKVAVAYADSSGYYVYLSGTSMATPLVAGAVALLWSVADKEGISLTAEQLKDDLLNGVRTESSLSRLVSSGGILDLADVVKQVEVICRTDAASGSTTSSTLSDKTGAYLVNSMITAPSITGYDSSGVTSYTVTSDDSQTATFTYTPHTYSINYSGTDGASTTDGSSLPMTHTYDTTTSVPDLEEESKEFAGWDVSSGGETIAIFQKSLTLGAKAYTDDITLTARWGTVCTITYEGMSGASYGSAHPTSFLDSDGVAVSDPARTGYVFTGWDILCEGTTVASKVHSVPAGTYGEDITLVATWSRNFVQDSISYKITSADTVAVTGYSGSSTTLSIPATATCSGVTYEVTAIASNAFYGNGKIARVIIGSAVTKINSYAFYKARGLLKVTGGVALTSIGSRAFSGCTQLKVLGVSSVVLDRIGTYAFYNCATLKSVMFKSKKISSIGSSAFKKVYAHAVFNVPNSKIAVYRTLFRKYGLPASVSFE